MKTLTATLCLFLVTFSAFGQKVIQTKKNQTATVTVSGTAAPFDNDIGGMTASFEEIITGGPASSSIVIRGCKIGANCDVLETYTGNATSIRAPAVGTIYDYFTVTPTWSGGTSVKVVVNNTITISRNGGGGSGGAVTSIFGRAGVVTAQSGDYSCGQVTGCGGSGYQTVQSNGSAVTQRSIENFGSEFITVDNPGSTRTDITVNAIAEAKVTSLTTDLTARELTANKDTDTTLTANSDTKYPSQKAIKAYVDARVGGYATIQSNGTPLTQRSILNFGSEFTGADNSGATRSDISINAIAQAKVTGLVAALAAKFDIAGGTITGPTTEASDFTVQGVFNTSGPFVLMSTWPGSNPAVSSTSQTRLGFGSSGKLGRSINGDVFQFFGLENADTTGNSATTTKFFTVPTLCGSGSVPRGVDEFGNVVNCTSSSGVNTAMSNLATTAINASLIPGVDNTIDAGSGAKRWRQVFAGQGAATGSAAIPSFNGQTLSCISAPTAPSAGILNIYCLTSKRFNDQDSAGVIGTTVVPRTAATHNVFCGLNTSGVLLDCQLASTDLSDTVFSSTTTQDVLSAPFYCLDTSSGNNFNCTYGPTVDAAHITAGLVLHFKAGHGNTGAATFGSSGGFGGARTLNKVTGGVATALASGDICTGQMVDMMFDGTNFQMQSPVCNATSGGVSSVFGRTGTVVAATNDYTPTQVGLGAVSNDTQTKAAVMPNTTPSAGQIPVGNAGATAYAPVTMSGDGTLSSTGAFTAGGNTVTAASAATGAKQICVASGATKTCTYITFPSEIKLFPAANCAAAAGASAYSYASGWTPVCRAGTNNLNGVLQAIPSTGGTAYIGSWEIPLDWDSTVQPFIGVYYGSGANTSGTVVWTISSGCTKSDGSVTDDPTWVAESAMGTQTMAAASRMWRQTAQFANVTSGNNCVGGGTMFVKIVLSGTAASAINLDKISIGSAGRLLTASQAN